jgi:hypothetical protein
MAFRRIPKTDAQLAANDAVLLHRVRSLFAVVVVLMIAAFLYASTVPLVFAVPDYRARLAEILAPTSWQTGRSFDWVVNCLALIPLGFCWSGALVNPFTTAALQRRTFSRSAGYRVARGCLVVAAFAEFLQIWLPLRVPSLRDLIALESGAIVGCGLWRLVDTSTMTISCLVVQRLAPRRRRRQWVAPWMILFGLLLSTCLAINICARPARCFEMYRRRSFSLSVGARQIVDPVATLFSSAGTALVLVGFCGLGILGLDRDQLRLAGREDVSMRETIPQAANVVGNFQQAGPEGPAVASLPRAA